MTLVRCAAALCAASTLLCSPVSTAHDTRDRLEHAATAPAPGAGLEAVSGTVRELVIDDQVAKMTVRYLFVVPIAGEAVALAGPGVDTLADGALATVTGRRNGNVLFVESLRAQKAAPGSARPAATRRAEGTLALAHADDFVTGKSAYLYEVHGDDGSVTRLKLAVRPEALQPGMRVAASGNADAASEALDPARIDVLALPAADIVPEAADKRAGIRTKAATTHSVLVILMKFTDTAADPLALSSVQSLMTTGGTSVANFYREASYGQHPLNPTLPAQWLRATIATPATCDYSAIGSAGDAAATAAGYNLAAYQFRVYIFPRVAACGWSGLAYIGSPKKSWINGASSVATSVIAHEMGHNFGLLHAASVDCGTRPIGGTCTASEYGDPFNTMGNQRAMHFDAAQKSLLGWIAPATVALHTGGTSTYVLTPLETGAGALYAVKIAAAAKRTYWLEYRQPIGFDAFLGSYPNNGAQVRVASPFETMCSSCNAYSDDTELLDMTPGTSPLTDGSLVAGSSYTDPDYGFTVNVLSATASALTVQVSGPGAAPAPTTTALQSSRNPSTAGASVTFTATVNGTAPTGSVAFADNGATIAGCSAVALTGSGNPRTAACATAALAAGTHGIVASYGGNASNAASTSAPLAQTVAVAGGTDANVALASAGATAIASSTYSGYYAVQAVNDNDRKGAGSGARWRDATNNVWPDWVEIDFSGTKTIDRVVVYSVQDNYLSPVEPTDTTTFTRYGLKAFQVQGWGGSSWVTLASVSGNDLVKRTVNVTPYTTSRIRVYITGAADGAARIVELEAWGH